jgi:hypothetical protein
VPRKFRKAFERVRYSGGETKLLLRLIAEGHTPQSCAIIMNRSARAIAEKAVRLGHPFGRGIEDGVLVRFNLEAEAFVTLRAVAHEIQISPQRLARICINIIAQQNKWAELLRLSDEEAGSADAG